MSKQRIWQVALVILLAGFSAACGAVAPLQILRARRPSARRRLRANRASLPGEAHRRPRHRAGTLPRFANRLWQRRRSARAPTNIIAGRSCRRKPCSNCWLPLCVRRANTARSPRSAAPPAATTSSAASFIRSTASTGPTWSLAFRWKLICSIAKSGETVWSDRYSHDEPVNGKTVADVVEAMDRDVRAGMNAVHDQPGPVFRRPPAANSSELTVGLVLERERLPESRVHVANSVHRGLIGIKIRSRTRPSASRVDA